jgi:monoamine oxidase
VIPLAIVGAGAAGISAAREARRRGIEAIVVEASDRVGGRAHSVNWHGHSLDLGAGWLHSAERNPLVSLAEQRGLEIDRSKTPWRGQYRELGFSRDAQAEAYEAFAAFEGAVAHPQPGDVAAAALTASGPWNAFIDALSGYLNGTSLSHMSAADYAAYSAASSANNWRVRSGYGALVASLAEDLRVEHGFSVHEIDWDGEHVRLSSDRGTVAAERAIVTVSSTVLASGMIRFLPPLDDHLHAAAQLPLGHVEKLFFALDQPEEFPNDAHLIGDPHRTDTGSYMLHPVGLPIVECFFGGDWVAGSTAESLEALARVELCRLLGSDFSRRIQRIGHSCWEDDPLFRGSYSYAVPERHVDRRALGCPIADRLAFAGEACSEVDFSTVHGAWDSGIAAVNALLGEDRDAD